MTGRYEVISNITNQQEFFADELIHSLFNNPI